MNLVVEDGTFVPGANTYISLADATTYWTNWGYTADVGTDTTAQTVALYYAAYAMERLYGRFYIGQVAKNSPQNLLFPRVGTHDRAPYVRVQDTTGTGAKFFVRVVDGVIQQISVIEGGSNYTSP